MMKLFGINYKESEKYKYADEYLDVYDKWWEKYHPTKENKQPETKIEVPVEDNDLTFNIDIPTESEEESDSSSDNDGFMDIINHIQNAPKDKKEHIKNVLLNDGVGSALSLYTSVVNTLLDGTLTENSAKEILDQFQNSIIALIEKGGESQADTLITEEAEKIISKVTKADVTTAIIAVLRLRAYEVKMHMHELNDSEVYGWLYETLMGDLVLKHNKVDVLKNASTEVRDKALKLISNKFQNEINDAIKEEINKLFPEIVSFDKKEGVKIDVSKNGK